MYFWLTTPQNNFLCTCLAETTTEQQFGNKQYKNTVSFHVTQQQRVHSIKARYSHGRAYLDIITRVDRGNDTRFYFFFFNFKFQTIIPRCFQYYYIMLNISIQIKKKKKTEVETNLFISEKGPAIGDG